MIFVSHQNGIESDLITGRINALILEDSEEYTYLVEILWNQIHKIEEKLLFYGKENELLDMSKRCDIIFSPRDLSFQNSKISKKLFAYLTEQIQMSGLNDEIIKNHAELLQLMDEVKNISEYTICIEEEYSLSDILKNVGIKLVDSEGSFCEKLIDYAKINYDFLKIDVLFLVGCKAYLKESDYYHLEKWTEYQCITIVLIENDDNRLPLGINKYIIDKDKCVIY